MCSNNNIENNETENLQMNNSELDNCKNELNQLRDSFIRLTADFENYKRRIVKEKGDWVISSQSDILMDILPIVDDFDRAFQEYKKGINKDLDNWIIGFELIYKLLYKFLEKYSVQEIKDFSTFNPEIHEAIAQIESVEHQSGQIVSVVQKGFMLKGRILRPAKVTVAK